MFSPCILTYILTSISHTILMAHIWPHSHHAQDIHQKTLSLSLAYSRHLYIFMLAQRNSQHPCEHGNLNQAKARTKQSKTKAHWPERQPVRSQSCLRRRCRYRMLVSTAAIAHTLSSVFDNGNDTHVCVCLSLLLSSRSLLFCHHHWLEY